MAKKNKRPPEVGEPPTYTLIDRRNPLNALPPAEREHAREFAKRRGKRLYLPGNWRAVVVAICSRSWSQPLLARALGGSVDWLQARIADTPALGELIAECDANFTQRLERVVEERALQGDPNCAMHLLKSRDPKKYGDKPQVQVNNNTLVNNAALPPPISAEEYARLISGAGAQPALSAPSAEATP